MVHYHIELALSFDEFQTWKTRPSSPALLIQSHCPTRVTADVKIIGLDSFQDILRESTLSSGGTQAFVHLVSKRSL